MAHEIGDKHIGFAPDLAQAVRGKHQLAAVMGEHGEAVEAFIVCYSLDIAAVDVDHIKVEVTPFRVVHIG